MGDKIKHYNGHVTKIVDYITQLHLRMVFAFICLAKNKTNRNTLYHIISTLKMGMGTNAIFLETLHLKKYPRKLRKATKEIPRVNTPNIYY